MLKYKTIIGFSLFCLLSLGLALKAIAAEPIKVEKVQYQFGAAENSPTFSEDAEIQLPPDPSSVITEYLANGTFEDGSRSREVDCRLVPRAMNEAVFKRSIRQWPFEKGGNPFYADGSYVTYEKMHVRKDRKKDEEAKKEKKDEKSRDHFFYSVSQSGSTSYRYTYVCPPLGFGCYVSGTEKFNVETRTGFGHDREGKGKDQKDVEEKKDNPDDYEDILVAKEDKSAWRFNDEKSVSEEMARLRKSFFIKFIITKAETPGVTEYSKEGGRFSGVMGLSYSPKELVSGLHKGEKAIVVDAKQCDPAYSNDLNLCLLMSEINGCGMKDVVKGNQDLRKKKETEYRKAIDAKLSPEKIEELGKAYLATWGLEDYIDFYASAYLKRNRLAESKEVATSRGRGTKVFKNVDRSAAIEPVK